MSVVPLLGILALVAALVASTSKPARAARRREPGDPPEPDRPPPPTPPTPPTPPQPPPQPPPTPPEPPPVDPPPTRVSQLKLGSKGRDVRQVQARLRMLGFDPGPIDGDFGAKTEAAVKAFQESKGLKPDGIVGPNTSAAILAALKNLKPKPPAAVYMKLGTRGPAVRTLQARLNVLGFNPGKADGIFGINTQAAVKAFQKSAGLRTDGIVGPKTQAALAAAKPPSKPPEVVPPPKVVPTPPTEPPPTSPPPAIVSVLKLGSKGREVRMLQARLKMIGFDPGPVDGDFGRRTDKAVRAFQAGRGLKPDGIVGKNTQAAILAALRTMPPPKAAAIPPTTPTTTPPPPPPPPPRVVYLKVGSRGADVASLQTRLNALGYNPGKADGIFGRRTEAAVKTFQSAHALKPDGIVGPNTRTALLNAKAAPTPPVVVQPVAPPPTTVSPTVTEVVPAPTQIPPPVAPKYPPTLRQGARGELVKTLQQELKKQGVMKQGAPEGYFGAGTTGAVKRFQTARRLRADGIVGPITWSALNVKMIDGRVSVLSGLASPGSAAMHIERIVKSGNASMISKAASLAHEEGHTVLAEKLARTASGVAIASPGAKFRSPFSSVTDARWNRFVRLIRGDDPKRVTPSNQLGLFCASFPRLAQLGLVTNVRRGTKRVDGKKRRAYIADWKPPLNLQRFLNDPKLQYDVFKKDVRGLAAVIGKRYGRLIRTTKINGKTISMSGLLAVGQMAGLKGLDEWLRMKPEQRTKFASTMQRFNAANGLF